jgi:hypothetical protein
MSRYEERLDAFAEGRRFARMSRPVRNRADTWCDACGSVQARVLFGVKDERSAQVSFVGEHCLQELAERGVIVRRFLRQSAEAAYAVRRELRQAAVSRETSTGEAPRSVAAERTTEGAGSTQAPAAFLVIAAPAGGSDASPIVVPMSMGGAPADRALELLRAWPGLTKQLLALGAGEPFSQASIDGDAAANTDTPGPSADAGTAPSEAQGPGETRRTRTVTDRLAASIPT